MIYQDLINRGLIYQTSSDEIEELVQKGNAVVYCGADATGPSMHIGHLIPFLTAKRILANPSNKLIILIGGLTATIGDPKATAEREIIDPKVVEENAQKLKVQFEKIFSDVKDQITIVNNADWGNKITLPEFLRDYGKLFNVNNMLAKEVVASRLETGISYAEFSYQILQAIDFQKLFDEYGCNVQIGGSDQWGNITAGIDLVRKSRSAKVHAMTVPLLLKSDGQKIGKTESGALFLNPKMTSEYEFYQYFINVADNDLENLFNKITFIPKQQIDEIIKTHNQDPAKRYGQNEITRAMMELIHDLGSFEKIQKITKVLFGENVELSREEFEYAQQQNIPNLKLVSAIDFITQIAEVSQKSKSEIMRLIKQGAVKLDNNKITKNIDSSSLKNYGIISLGKKQKILYARG
jgi:tyrosyl-tRNA synthetase